jgi:hypothetical protein
VALTPRPSAPLLQVSKHGEYVVTGLFTLEFLIKIISLGGFLHEVSLVSWVALSGEPARSLMRAVHVLTLAVPFAVDDRC